MFINEPARQSECEFDIFMFMFSSMAIYMYIVGVPSRRWRLSQSILEQFFCVVVVTPNHCQNRFVVTSGAK